MTYQSRAIRSQSQKIMKFVKIVVYFELKLQPDVLILLTAFYELVLSLNLFSKAKMHQYGAAGTQGLNNQHFVSI